MIKLIQLAQSAIDAEEPCILCSVVRLEGSGYGRVGARLLLTESGDREGYVSGGCLEKDLRRRAWSEAMRAPKLISFDTRGQIATGNPVVQSRYNTGCQGIVYVLCQPISNQDAFFIDVADRVIHSRQSARLLTVSYSESSMARTGDQAALYADGSSARSSNKLLDTNVMQSLLHRATGPFTATLLDRQGARIELTVEFIEPPPRLVLFGSGDDVVPVVHMAVGLGWDVCVAGRRAETTTPDRFPGARVHSGDVPSVPAAWFDDPYTHVVSMTHDMAFDVEILSMLLRANVGSIGMLGSKRRLARIAAELHNRGAAFDARQMERIRCPVGLDLGAVHPEEIALSIMAELVALVRGGSGALLSDRTGSIHNHLPHYNWEMNQMKRVGLPANRHDSDSAAIWPIHTLPAENNSTTR